MKLLVGLFYLFERFDVRLRLLLLKSNDESWCVLSVGQSLESRVELGTGMF